ncbi:nuclear transport factor 2 family protein [Elstera cyanobacteriorum]|uniref:nuclear transport factor 2 family protein n=1 Tax=Elstera cyanobacteriorum TaxID=2022747 RepID=UPI002352977B|nr:nuclear transport factor 2 family protein [Elstera cyanobacteriorum]MCK6444480.1 hypothetical protein [Elstera cyanobacteriorum]
MSDVDLVQQFLGYIFAGEMAQALALVHPQARFIGARPTGDARVPLYGTHEGRAGAEHFFRVFAEVLIPGDFEVIGRFGGSGYVTFFGKFCHSARKTGRPFLSDWALVVQIDNGMIRFYHFYEDTAALEAALLPTP